ncbi:MAG: hypothetical protein KGI54_10465 [Pseudomonadota bacterium]|nr:hypothetical protein [Pseudomonadota bacterium]
MYLYDDPSVVPVLPAPAAAGTGGYFTDGNPATSSPATVLRSDFMNMIMEELLNIVSAAGIAPSKTTYNQVLSAIEALIESRTGNYALDTGVANAYVIALNPVVAAYTNGLLMRFKVAHGNTGASTLNAGPGAISLVNDQGGALVNGDLQTGTLVTAVYDQATNSAILNSIVTSQALTETVANTLYALIGGSATQLFNAANGVAGNNVVNFSQSFGLGQTWSNQTASRVSGTVYTNSGSKSIAVSINSTRNSSGTGFGTMGQLYVNGNNLGYSPAAADISVADTISAIGQAFAIVSPGETYEFTGGGINSWWELS